ncbi:hypothetical protein JTE90_004521 [Oedothorax gibbosus]|uniref:Uncharacterized protein n=1 Tax=Oedothorax gibbosus TaxID=931172 RepID=A0AAV6VE37_9ARAC|nr:hypothetical protein JTE90_004521 [Oedothorax gibbosus]
MRNNSSVGDSGRDESHFSDEEYYAAVISSYIVDEVACRCVATLQSEIAGATNSTSLTKNITQGSTRLTLLMRWPADA